MFCRAIWSSPFGTCAICRNHYCPFHRGFNVSCYSMGFILLSAFLLLNQFQASLIISNVESNLVKSTLPLHLLANFRLSTVPNPEIPSWNTSFFGSFPFSITMIHHIFWGFLLAWLLLFHTANDNLYDGGATWMRAKSHISARSPAFNLWLREERR